MQHRRKLDRNFFDHRLLPTDLDLFGSVRLRQTIVNVSRRTGPSDVDEDVIEDEVLVMFGRRLVLIGKAKGLTGFAKEEPVNAADGDGES